MSQSAVHPLVKSHQHALKICLQNIAHLQKTINDLDTVKSQLETLPNKTRHDIMIPFGVSNPSSAPLMLMEGSIIHTNEIMVLLGDNWFVERSAKEATDIINRRKAKIKSLLEKLEVEKEQHLNLIRMIDNLYGQASSFIEINEKCDEEEEKRWREVHRQKVRENKKREAAERAKMNRESHDEVMKRLDQLELAESSPLKSSIKSGNKESKSVKFQEVDCSNVVDDEEEPEKESEKTSQKVIFSGEVVERSGKEEEEEEEVGRNGGGDDEVKEGNAPLHDPHKGQPPQPTKKVSQFKLARQSR